MLEFLYMKPEMENKISFRHEKKSVYITFHWGRNEMKFRLGGEQDLKTSILKTTVQKLYAESTHLLIKIPNFKKFDK